MGVILKRYQETHSLFNDNNEEYDWNKLIVTALIMLAVVVMFIVIMKS